MIIEKENVTLAEIVNDVENYQNVALNGIDSKTLQILMDELPELFPLTVQDCRTLEENVHNPDFESSYFSIRFRNGFCSSFMNDNYTSDFWAFGINEQSVIYNLAGAIIDTSVRPSTISVDSNELSALF